MAEDVDISGGRLVGDIMQVAEWNQTFLVSKTLATSGGNWFRLEVIGGG